MIQAVRPARPPQLVAVQCGHCKRVLGSVTAAIRETSLGLRLAAAMERGLVICPDCGPLDRGEALP